MAHPVSWTVKRKHVGGNLPDTEKTLSWRDLVSEGFADLCRSKGHAAVVKFEETAKVGEVALGSFRTKVSAVGR